MPRAPQCCRLISSIVSRRCLVLNNSFDLGCCDESMKWVVGGIRGCIGAQWKQSGHSLFARIMNWVAWSWSWLTIGMLHARYDYHLLFDNLSGYDCCYCFFFLACVCVCVWFVLLMLRSMAVLRFLQVQSITEQFVSRFGRFHPLGLVTALRSVYIRFHLRLTRHRVLWWQIQRRTP